MQVELSPALIHAVCYAYVNTPNSALSIHFKAMTNLIHCIAECTDYRELTELEIISFKSALLEGKIELT